MQIVEAVTAEHIAQVRELFEEYWASFGFTPCFQNFGAELAGLPGEYQPPGGRLALALVDGQPAGCVALRRLDGERCELSGSTCGRNSAAAAADANCSLG